MLLMFSVEVAFLPSTPVILDISALLMVARPPMPYTTRLASPEAIAMSSSSLLYSASMLRSPRELFKMYSSLGSSWLNTGFSIAHFKSRKLSTAMQSNSSSGNACHGERKGKKKGRCKDLLQHLPWEELTARSDNRGWMLYFSISAVSSPCL